ncbi:flavin-containing monooxygenase [Nocardioides kongjuensis]|uniref:Putative flavoprotein involved in K+ transport n=1 Tax=Nocardioides kongjuensis TaxID=349522 RepID=A0A852RII7_9ACTN|nr:NAD(P)-binding domain-containing protein [Nocardioides kongjuensis]NYD28680.1 putative flavoprotein involved in K+ transport [Nocardioides kongjuensis]
MSTQHIETLIIGAGQAGLATGHALQGRGRRFLIVDGAERVGDNWRAHYDSLRLYSPAKYDGLPGLRFPAAPWTYPSKDDVADYLEKYAVEFDLPVRMRTRIDRLARRTAGGFTAAVGDDTITCDNVVVATGSFGRTPHVPDVAAGLDPSIRQLHSTQYKRPDDLAEGRVLVVGASHSGCDIAYEVAEHRPTTLVGRDCGQIPFRWEKKAIRRVFPVLVFVWRHVLTRRTPLGRKEMEEVRHHGGPMLRVKREDLAQRGVERIEQRVSGVRDGLPVLEDGTVVDAATVIWATGFEQAFGWIDLPAIGPDGWPQEYRGVVDQVPGLFFCGLSFQFAFSSMVLPGVGRDAEYVARRIAARGSEAAAA